MSVICASPLYTEIVADVGLVALRAGNPKGNSVAPLAAKPCFPDAGKALKVGGEGDDRG